MTARYSDPRNMRLEDAGFLEAHVKGLNSLGFFVLGDFAMHTESALKRRGISQSRLTLVERRLCAHGLSFKSHELEESSDLPSALRLPKGALFRAAELGILTHAQAAVLSMLYGLEGKRRYGLNEVCDHLGKEKEEVEEMQQTAFVRMSQYGSADTLCGGDISQRDLLPQTDAVEQETPAPLEYKPAMVPAKLENSEPEKKEDLVRTFARYLKAMIELYGKFPWVIASDICGSSTTANACSARHMLMYLLWRNGGFSYHQIADILNKTYGATCRGIKRIKVLLEKNDQQTIDDFARFRSKMGWTDA